MAKGERFERRGDGDDQVGQLDPVDLGILRDDEVRERRGETCKVGSEFMEPAAGKTAERAS